MLAHKTVCHRTWGLGMQFRYLLSPLHSLVMRKLDHITVHGLSWSEIPKCSEFFPMCFTVLSFYTMSTQFPNYRDRAFSNTYWLCTAFILKIHLLQKTSLCVYVCTCMCVYKCEMSVQVHMYVCRWTFTYGHMHGEQPQESPVFLRQELGLELTK